MPWRQTPSRKKKAVVFTDVTETLIRVNLTLDFRTYVKYLKFAIIESFKYIRELLWRHLLTPKRDAERN